MNSKDLLGNFKEGPIRYSTLPDDMLKAIDRLYKTVGKHIFPSLEKWESGFMRDLHPEKEIAVWLDIESALLRLLEREPQADQSKATQLFCQLSMGVPLRHPWRAYWRGKVKPLKVFSKSQEVAEVHFAERSVDDGQHQTGMR